MSSQTLDEVALFFKKLLGNLCHQNYLKKRFSQRVESISSTFEELTGPNSKLLDDEKLRDAFFMSNLVVPLDDVQRFLKEVSSEGKVSVTEGELRSFLKYI